MLSSLGSASTRAGDETCGDLGVEGCELNMRLCHQARSEVNRTLQMMSLSARQVYKRYMSQPPLRGRPLLISPSGLLALMRESSLDLAVGEDGRVVCIQHGLRAATLATYAANLKDHASITKNIKPVLVYTYAESVSADVLEACRSAECSHQQVMAKILGNKRAAAAEDIWKEKHTNYADKICSICGNINPHSLESSACCRSAHRNLAQRLPPTQQAVFDNVWDFLLSS